MSPAALKIAHILCACLFIGNVIVSGVWAAMAERTQDHTIIRFSNRMVLITDVLFTAGGSIGIVLTGYLMAHRWGGETAHPWIQWSYILFGLSGLIWLFVGIALFLALGAVAGEDARLFGLIPVGVGAAIAYTVGHMGLGIFIAKTLLERSGAEVEFANRTEGGAEVVIRWNGPILEMWADRQDEP